MLKNLQEIVLKVYESKSFFIRRKSEYLLTVVLLTLFFLTIILLFHIFFDKELIYIATEMSFIPFCGISLYLLSKGKLEKAINFYIFAYILVICIDDIIVDLLVKDNLTHYRVLALVAMLIVGFFMISLVSIKRYQTLLILYLSCLLTVIDSAIIYLKYYSNHISINTIGSFLYYFILIIGGGIFCNNLLKMNDEAFAIVDKRNEMLELSKTELEIMVRERTKELSFMNEKLLALVYYDPLTGLPNRKKMIEKFNIIINNKNEKFAVFFIDLDNFKNINDNFGHQAGDYVLIQVSEILKSTIRSDDIIGRIGGDEFIIILGKLKSSANAEKIALKIGERLSSAFIYKENHLFVGASIGISIFPEHGTSVDTLIKNADIAMYEVKHKGGYGYTIYSSKMDDKTINKLEMKRKLNNAMENNEFRAYYQPIIDLKSMKIISSEALIRWCHEDKIIPPAEFIPIAKNIGEIVVLDNWMLENACIQCKKWHELGAKDFIISVNTSFKQLKQANFIELVLNILDTYSLSPMYLNLEITEDEAMEDYELIISILTRLKYHGIKISLDDFGTGYSSLSYVTRLPIDIIKIDKSLITNLEIDFKNTFIIKLIILMAHNLNIKVVAEGIENEAQFIILKDLKCDFIQGYFIGKPMAASDFEEKLSLSGSKSVG